MPNLEPVVLEGRSYHIRHVGPQSVLWPVPPVAVNSFVLLNQPAMSARMLPWANTPNAPDWVSGQWVGRLNDAGEFTLTFPNKEASDGPTWRQRFDPSGKNQWIEIWNDGYLEGVYCIQKMELKQDQIVISGNDAWYQLKSAYERDWTVIQAPRDVIERGTTVEIPMAADGFTNPVLDPQWHTVLNAGGTVTTQSNGVVVLDAPAAAAANAGIQTVFVTTIIPTRAWRANCALSNVSIVNSTESSAVGVTLGVEESSGSGYSLQFAGKHAYLEAAGGITQSVTVPSATTYSLSLESDGEWIFGFINGLLVGCMRRSTVATNELSIFIVAHGQLVGSTTATVTSASLTASQAFLQTGTDKGDYVLPGSTTTYPNGGLHARYFNNLDLQGDGNRLTKIHAPPRTAVYAGSGSSEYANQQDATINGQANPLPGASTSYWSAIWFGAIYLKLSAGNYPFAVVMPATPASTAVRVWVGKTQLEQQLMNHWSFSIGASYSATLTASDLAGTLSYGAGTVVRDGWYPIKIEYAVDSAASNGVAPQFKFTPPASYTDPGGTALVGGVQVIVPATSLSPLGCVDQRYQGISHFDLVQKTSQAFGYQLSCEPYQLETLASPVLGTFPGVLSPRIQEGHDTDAVLIPDTTPRSDGEGLVGYGNLLDATDNCSSLQGNGAGFQNGSAGQLQSEVFDVPTLDNSLFNTQGWQDFSDASFSSLLTALLNSEIGLRLAPWQTVTGQPMGRPRLSHSWPLTPALAQMRWRPGDGLRVQARDIRLFDLTPRQLLVVTRAIHPNGATGTQVTFASRPRTEAHTLKKQLFTTTRWQRNYQKQLVTLVGGLCAGTIAGGSGTFYVGATGFPQWSAVALSPGDQVLRARVRITHILGTNPSIGILHWTGAGGWVDDTTTLNGPFNIPPLNIDISSILTISTDNRAVVIVSNKSANAITDINFQLLLDVLR